MYSFLTFPYHQGGDWDVTAGAWIRCNPMSCESHLISHGIRGTLLTCRRESWLLSNVSVPLLQCSGLECPALRNTSKGRLTRGRAGLSPRGSRR